MSPKMLDLTAVAERLNVKPSTVRSLLVNGELPGIKIGRQWRIDGAILERFLESRLKSGSVRSS